MSDSKKTLTIGRYDAKNPNATQPDIPITGEGNNTVSRKHATLSITERKGVYLLNDAGSKNHTYYLDGDTWKKVNNTEVTPLTRVKLGLFEETIGALVHAYNRRNPPVRRRTR